MPAFSISDPVPWFRETPNASFTFANEIGQTPIQSKFQADLRPGPVPKTLHYPKVTPLSITLEGPVLRLSEVPVGGPDIGVRFLPWREDHCSYMQLDAQARFALTGPLSGCNIYTAGDAEKPCFFHANSNENVADLDQNNGAKRKMVLDLLAAGVAGRHPANVAAKLERQHYATRGFLGFVFGYKKANAWEFYFYGNGNGTVYVRRMG